MKKSLVFVALVAIGLISLLCGVYVVRGTSLTSNGSPEDWILKFSGPSPVFLALTPNLQSGTLRITEVWKYDDARRNLDYDPCDPIRDSNGNKTEIDDDIFWIEPDGYSTNYDFGKIKIAIVEPLLDIAFKVFNHDLGTTIYGYYPSEVGSGRFGICVDTKKQDIVRAWVYTAVRLVHTEEQLYQPTNVQLYSNKTTVLTWEINSHDTGDGTIIYRVDSRGNSKVFYLADVDFYQDTEKICDEIFVYYVASRSKVFDSKPKADYPYGAHSKWSKPVSVIINTNCAGSGGSNPPNPGGNPDIPPIDPPLATSTPTSTPEVVECGDEGNGAYLYQGKDQGGSCYFISEGETKNPPFSAQSVYLKGDGVSISLCSTSDGTEPCSEYHKDKDDLSGSSIFGKFNSAKVSHGYTDDCGNEEHGVRIYSEKHMDGSCKYLEPGRYHLSFSPRSMEVLGSYMGAQLCKNEDGHNPCSEFHHDEDDLSDDSNYGNFNSIVVEVDKPKIGDFKVEPLGWATDGSYFEFNAFDEGGSGGPAIVTVQLIQDPELNSAPFKQQIQLVGSTKVLVRLPALASTMCFYVTIDPDRQFNEVNPDNNSALYCKDGTQLYVPDPGNLIPERSLIVGDTFVFAPQASTKVRPDFGEGSGQTAQVVVLEGHRPLGWMLSTPSSTENDIYLWSEAKRIEIINNLLLNCKSLNVGCAQAQEFRISEDGSVQEIVHTTLLDTPTPIGTSTPTPTLTSTPSPTPTATNQAPSAETSTPTVTPTVTPTMTTKPPSSQVTPTVEQRTYLPQTVR